RPGVLSSRETPGGEAVQFRVDPRPLRLALVPRRALSLLHCQSADRLRPVDVPQRDLQHAAAAARQSLVVVRKGAAVYRNGTTRIGPSTTPRPRARVGGAALLTD